ncbi:SNF2 family N-terminal domain-containing protein [Lentinula raphanica]|nr:SNF2 family N-terminal domain-containing protein [Lentinula raphanica]
MESLVDDLNDKDEDAISPDEVDRALRELMGGAMNSDGAVDINPEDGNIEGFKEGYRLLDHQIIGKNWMKHREDPNLKRMGGILADDMGLGKTIQALARIVEGRPQKTDKEEGWDPATLVVCPLALVQQWADEIANITDGFAVVIHHGTLRADNPKSLKRAHIVITTYDTLKSECKASKTRANTENGMIKPVKDALFHVRWFRVILDEAHSIKNKGTSAAKACVSLESKFRWALTGTPMQNDLAELYPIFQFLRIKPFSSWKTFNEQIARPVKSGRGANRAMKRLQVVLKHVMLRRRKDDTLNGKSPLALPKRIVNVVPCTFSSFEREFYDGLEARMTDIVDNLVTKANRGRQKTNYMSVLQLLLRLRQACNHPALASKDYFDTIGIEEFGDSSDSVENSLDNALQNLQMSDGHIEDATDFDSARVTQQNFVTAHPDSAKIRMIHKLLHKIKTDSQGVEKTIIFSQFTTMLDLLEPCLHQSGTQFVRYDGTMKPKEREASLHAIKYQDSVKVILISLKAGSTGLNLAVCNNVILVDLWWNPALEDQAFDRAHRYGQKRDVIIYKLKVDNTVEDRILELQDRKRALAGAVLSGDKIRDLHLGMDELLALFKPGHGYESDNE